MKDIVIIGAGGFGREVAQLIEEINSNKNTWNLLGFIDETPEKQNIIISNYPVLGNFQWIEREKSNRNELWAVCAIGNPKAKYNLVTRSLAYDIKFTNLIHPDAKVSKYTRLGIGCIVCCYSFISVNTKIGNHVSINPGCGIGHDVTIEDYSSLYWNVTLSGNVCIHEGCEVGSKAEVIPQKTIGKWTTIGAGAVVTNNIPEYCIAVGVPAKPIKFFDNKSDSNIKLK